MSEKDNAAGAAFLIVSTGLALIITLGVALMYYSCH